MVENGKETIVNIDDEIPFDIPESWAWCRLGNLGEYKKGPFGSAITKSIFIEDTGSNPKVYEQKNAIYKNSIIGSYYITEEKFLELISFELNPDDIIVSCAGTIGETFIMPSDMRRGIMNQALMRVRLYNLQICKFYLIYFDLVLKKQSRLKGKGTAITNIPPLDILKKYLIPLPPLEEQKRIVEAIENLTNKISSIGEEYSSIEEKISLAKSKLLDLAIRGKLLPQDKNDEPASELLKHIREEKESAQLTSKGKRKTAESYIFKGEDNLYYEQIGSETKCIQDEIPFDIPANWAWCRLLEICKVYQPKTISTRQMVVDGEFVVFGANGIIGRYNEYNHKEAEVLITCRGATCGAINVSLPFSWINGNAMVISPLYENIPSKSFLELYLKGINMNEYITGTAQPQITREELSKMKLPIPPLEEQKRIVEYISKANNQLDSMLSE